MQTLQNGFFPQNYFFTSFQDQKKLVESKLFQFERYANIDVDFLFLKSEKLNILHSTYVKYAFCRLDSYLQNELKNLFAENFTENERKIPMSP